MSISVETLQERLRHLVAEVESIQEEIAKQKSLSKHGQVWTTHGCPYIIAKVDHGKLSLISLETGNRWNSPFSQSKLEACLDGFTFAANSVKEYYSR